ncbi:hypothetical protein B0H19DRAFT_1057181 [Mycena capillaripes]|nr:hypothetical protein B0H19DRAFT_1057181 [Mycena capillaripes]
MPAECTVKLYSEAQAQARASGLARASPGLGLGLENLKPRPTQARPKPGYPGRAGPGTSLGRMGKGGREAHSSDVLCTKDMRAAGRTHGRDDVLEAIHESLASVPRATMNSNLNERRALDAAVAFVLARTRTPRIRVDVAGLGWHRYRIRRAGVGMGDADR